MRFAANHHHHHHHHLSNAVVEHSVILKGLAAVLLVGPVFIIYLYSMLFACVLHVFLYAGRPRGVAHPGLSGHHV